MNQTEQMRELEATIRAQAKLIKAMEHTKSYLLSQQEKWVEATRTLESEREANRILTEELEQSRQALAHVNETPKNEHDIADVLKPAKLVRLTDDEIAVLKMKAWGCASIAPRSADNFANAVMDAMERVNSRQLDQTPKSPSE